MFMLNKYNHYKNYNDYKDYTALAFLSLPAFFSSFSAFASSLELTQVNDNWYKQTTVRTMVKNQKKPLFLMEKIYYLQLKGANIEFPLVKINFLHQLPELVYNSS